MNYLYDEIYHFPQSIEPLNYSVTLGDLHGNTLKLIYLLFRHGFIDFIDQGNAYSEFVTIYEEMNQIIINDNNSSEKLRRLMTNFDLFLKKIKIKQNTALIRLIGDDLADRGNNDYFTLTVFDLLHKSNISVNTLFSNHGADFILSYENYIQTDNFEILGNMSIEFKQSILGLKLLLDQKIIDKKQLVNLVEEGYLPTLKLLDYELKASGITLYSHAPIALEIIQYVAIKFGVSYHDSTAESLGHTIDKINAQFQTQVKNHCVTHYLILPKEWSATDMKVDEYKEFPVIYIIWNRFNSFKDTLIARPKEKNGYLIRYVHGHDSTYQSQYEHITNLDNFCGKASLLETQAAFERIANVMKNDCDEEKRKLYQHILSLYAYNDIWS